jgi:outer membrane protein assembly factor BamB
MQHDDAVDRNDDDMHDVRFTRRSAVGLGTGIALTGLGLQRATAQEASPEASPVAAGGEAAEAEFPTATPLGDAIPPEITADPTNWAVENYDLKGTRNIPGSQISTSTISELGIAWNMPVTVSAAFGALVANPVIVGDVLYQQDAQANVYAVNKTTGDVLWTNIYGESVPSGGPNGCCVAYGNVYYTLGGTANVVAANAETGEELWRTSVLGYLDEGITMAPLVYDSTVYVSTIPGSSDSFYGGGQRGYVFALDAGTGQILWYFDTTTDNLWNNARVNSGGGLWHVPSVDDEGNLYLGVANAAPYPGTPGHPEGTSREGDNDYANSLVKLDPETASVEWYLNVKPHDLFDLDNQLTPILGTIDVAGTPTNVAFTSGKHGIVVAVNTDTGEEIWRTPVGQHKNDDTIDIPDGESLEVLPGTLGGVETSMALANGVVFAPIVNLATWYTPGGIDAEKLDIFAGTGELTALDAATGEILWTVELPTPAYGAATVVNDVVFTAGLDGYVRAFNTADGSAVWEWQAPAGINAPLAVAGDYLYVPAGGPFVNDGAPAPVPNLVALTLGGTGTIAGSAEATPEAGAATPAVSAYQVSAVDINFDPKELTIPANTDVTITFTNAGLLQHDFVIDALSIKSDLLNGGDSVEIVINAPAGTYEYYCSVPGHREAGMVGTLTVQ